MPWRHTEKWSREDHIGTTRKADMGALERHAEKWARDDNTGTTRKADVGALETHREVGAGRSHRNNEEG